MSCKLVLKRGQSVQCALLCAKITQLKYPLTPYYGIYYAVKFNSVGTFVVLLQNLIYISVSG